MGHHSCMRALGSVVAATLIASAVSAEARVPDRVTPGSAVRALSGAQKSRVVADSFWSQALGTRKRFLVYLPASYDARTDRRYPVLYYLHGLWGNERDWVVAGRIDSTLDALTSAGMPEPIVVMPDGDDSWYTTWNGLANLRACEAAAPRDEPASTYCVPWARYDDYIARDLVARVDSSYRTLADRRHRAIAGLSMGGYGAITLALNYPDAFVAAASHSGVLAPLYMGPHPFTGTARWARTESEIRDAQDGRWPKIFPAFGRDTAGWWARDPGRLAARLIEERRGPMPAIMLDVGRDDHLVDQSRAFRATLQRLGVPHEYRERAGKHDWDYWRTHASESLRWLMRQFPE